jgi:uncharacterized membrane protein
VHGLVAIDQGARSHAGWLANGWVAVEAQENHELRERLKLNGGLFNLATDDADTI